VGGGGGRSEIPAELLTKGLTVREYEVLLLLHDRQANEEIAQRLFISPRTVEKHVGSLLTKTGCDDRTALRDYATDLMPPADIPAREYRGPSATRAS
jgi:DNA-binding NarL/FixJ family response regulator